jgi:hypothetical protein
MEEEVASQLRSRLYIIDVVEELVQRRSRIECFGNAVFTLMLLKRVESRQPVTADFVSQACLNACFRSVCARPPALRPNPVEFKAIDVQTCIRDAQTFVTTKMSSFDSDLCSSISNSLHQ